MSIKYRCIIFSGKGLTRGVDPLFFGKIQIMKAGFHRVLKNKDSLKLRVRQKTGSRAHSPQEGSVMRCHRCKGMMVYEKFYGDCGFFCGWRCVFCGEIIDQVILEDHLDNI